MSDGEPKLTISRREAIQRIGETAVVAAGAVKVSDAIGATDALANMLDKLRNLSGEKKASQQSAGKISAPSIPAAEPIVSIPAKVPEGLTPSSESKFPSASSPTDRESAKVMVEEQLKHYRDEPAIEDRIERVKSWVPVIKELSGQFGSRHDPLVVDTLPGLIYVESEGIPDVTTKNKKGKIVATGLCQVKAEVAAEVISRTKGEREDIRKSLQDKNVAKDDLMRLEKELKNIDAVLSHITYNGKGEAHLLDPATNITVAAEYLNRLLIRFHDPDIAVWAYNFGQGNVIDVLKTYTTQILGMKSDEVDRILSMPQGGAAKLIKDKQIHFAPLMNFFKEKHEALGYREENQESTFYYASRVEAANRILKDAV